MGLRLLLVEDNPDHALLAELALSRHPAIAAVRSVGSAEEALAVLQQAPADFDGVLTDLNLPGLGGQALIERLAQDPATARLPVLVLTTSASETALAAALGAGARACLVKPVGADEVVGLLAGR